MARFLGIGNGKDGSLALGSYTQTWISCSGTSGSSSLSATGTFSAGDRLFIIQSRGTGVGSYEDNRVLSYTSGTITLQYPLENTYTDSGASQAQVTVVKEASVVTGSYTVSAWNGDVGGGFVVACSGVFSGVVNGTGKGYVGGRSGANPDVDNQDGEQGEGTSGAASRTSAANGNGGGGGTERQFNEQGNGGGGGGHAASGQNGAFYTSGGSVGVGGSAVGSANLSSGIFFGGAGGGGGFGDAAQSPTGNGNGGNGGGFIVIYANSFSSTASLVVDGVAGQSGAQDQGAGGGGAGGTILIKTRFATLGTVTSLGTSAAGGNGGGGGAGSAGRIRIESCSLSGTTNPTASSQIGGHNYCGGSAFLF